MKSYHYSAQEFSSLINNKIKKSPLYVVKPSQITSTFHTKKSPTSDKSQIFLSHFFNPMRYPV